MVAVVAYNRIRQPVEADDRQVKKESPGVRPGPCLYRHLPLQAPDGRDVWLEETAKAEFDALARASLTARGVPPSLVTRGRVSFWERYGGTAET
jgi:hypothetical protein